MQMEKRTMTNILKVAKPSITISARGTIGYSVKRLEPFYPVGLIVVTPKNYDELYLDYLFYYLKIIDFIHSGTSIPQLTVHSGTSIPQLTVPMIKDYEILIPPLTEQNHIVSILDKCFENIDKAIEITKQNLNNTKQLFQSYLNQVFTQKGKNWQTKKLKEICIIQPSKDEIKNKLDKSDLVSFLPMADLERFQYEIKPKKLRKLEEVEKSYTYFSDNDVLLAKITPCFENGKLGIVKNLINRIGFGSSEFIVFRCNNDLLPEYLFYFLATQNFKNEGKNNMQGAVGHRRISKEWIENYSISFPKSIPDQKILIHRIYIFLSETQKLENIYKQELSDLESLKKSILQKAFSGNLKT